MQVGYSVQDQVYLTLRTQILNLNLAPGTTMSTQELAGQLKVSRTPVREALIRLQRDGLVLSLPQRETTVTRIDMRRAAQERFMRKSLETAVLEPFLAQTGFDQLKELNELIQKQLAAASEENYEALLEYDDAFHQIFFVQAGEPLAWDILEQMNTHYKRVRLLSLRTAGTAQQTVMQHVELLRALENGQLAEAQEILGSHLQKLDEEETELRESYPDYFVSETAEENTLLSLDR